MRSFTRDGAGEVDRVAAARAARGVSGRDVSAGDSIWRWMPVTPGVVPGASSGLSADIVGPRVGRYGWLVLARGGARDARGRGVAGAIIKKFFGCEA